MIALALLMAPAGLAPVSVSGLLQALAPTPPPSADDFDQRGCGSKNRAMVEGGKGPLAPASRATAPLEGPALELEINNNTSETTVSWGHISAPCVRSGGPDGATAYYSQTGFTASASLPIGGKDNLIDPQLLNKLSNGASFTLGVSRFGFSGSDSGPTYRPGSGWQIGGQASIGYNDFEYRQPVTLSSASVGKVQYSVGAFAALFPVASGSLQGDSSIGGSVEYQHAYKALDDIIQCKPVVLAPAYDCANGAPGRPAKDDGLLIAVEYRKTIGIGWNFAKLAVSPRATIDALDGTVGVELPIYLLPEAEASVLPGFKIGYSSHDDSVVVGLFLKGSFGFYH